MAIINKKTIRTQPSGRDMQERIRRSIYNTERWRRLRRLHLLGNPLCAACLRQGIVREAKDVHHLESFMKGLTPEHRRALAFNPANLESLCKQCHQKEHHQKKKE